MKVVTIAGTSFPKTVERAKKNISLSALTKHVTQIAVSPLATMDSSRPKTMVAKSVNNALGHAQLRSLLAPVLQTIVCALPEGFCLTMKTVR